MRPALSKPVRRITDTANVEIREGTRFAASQMTIYGRRLRTPTFTAASVYDASDCKPEQMA